jgi:hypothetical protein
MTKKMFKIGTVFLKAMDYTDNSDSRESVCDKCARWDETPPWGSHMAIGCRDISNAAVAAGVPDCGSHTDGPAKLYYARIDPLYVDLMKAKEADDGETL